MEYPLTNIHPEAKIVPNVHIGPFTTIQKNVEIGEGCWIGSNVNIMDGARIGKNVKIFPGAVISAEPQDLKYKGEETLTIIGDRTVIREFVTINKGTTYNNQTVVGSDCLLMAYVHVAHDCIVGNHCILANAVTLAGHIVIDDWAILNGMVAVQQFIHIGAHTYISGGSLVRKDVPPFVKAAREPLSYAGINTVGLTRRGFSEEKISLIQDIYRILYVHNKIISKGIKDVEDKISACEEKDFILDFIRNSTNGIMKGYSTEESAV